MKDLGQVAYEGYAAHTGGKTFDGRDMPTWDALPDRIRGAWRAAIEAAFAEEMKRHIETAPPSFNVGGA